jgi:hypothetical protein
MVYWVSEEKLKIPIVPAFIDILSNRCLEVKMSSFLVLQTSHRILISFFLSLALLTVHPNHTSHRILISFVLVLLSKPFILIKLVRIISIGTAYIPCFLFSLYMKLQILNLGSEKNIFSIVLKSS